MIDISVYLTQWLALTLVVFLAAISPGPDFVVSVRNSLVYNRRAGIFTAFGFGLSILIHVAYTVLGIAAIIAQSILLFNLIKYAGAAYLIYLGIQAWRSKGMGEAALEKALHNKESHKNLSDWSALRSGFLTNLLNPKATMFFLAVFSQFIHPDTPAIVLSIYGITCISIITAWFCLVAIVLTHQKVRNIFLKATKAIDRTCGTLMIALGIKVALTTK